MPGEESEQGYGLSGANQMRRSGKTSMGGMKNGFQTTHWSEIRNARTQDQARRRIVIDSLSRRYWKPIYCYLRRKGYDNEQAKDLTQGFFHEVVLGRDLVQRANEARGRFRSFLLTALNNYIVGVHRANVAGKRRPEDGVVSLEEFDEESMSIAAKDMRPEDIFTYVWASVLVDEVISEVRGACFRDGKKVHWQIFRARVLDPIVAGVKPSPVSELCRRFNIENKETVSNMIVTVKRRFQVAMVRRVRQHVDSDEEVEQEIQDLMKILSK
jgi:RNA polymerase sigma-70 factor (ECF subfamily)